MSAMNDEWRDGRDVGQLYCQSLQDGYNNNIHFSAKR
jgi:hypothetical protein